MTRELADTVKTDLREQLVAALYLRNTGNAKDDGVILGAILPIIEAELAQATADALDAAAQILIAESRERQRKAEVNDMERDKDSALAHRWDCILLDSLAAKIRALIPADIAAKAKEPIDGNTSDGFHTFNELYEHRHSLFAAVVAAYGGWKSKFHDDGTMFDGWFIAGVPTRKGFATYHMPLSLFASFPGEELERAPKWDGHTPKEAAERIASLSFDGIGEHDAKIKREAYLRCAEFAENSTGYHFDAGTFRRWANEADGVELERDCTSGPCQGDN